MTIVTANGVYPTMRDPFTEQSLDELKLGWEFRDVSFEEFGDPAKWTKENIGRRYGTHPMEVERYMRQAKKTQAPPPVVAQMPGADRKEFIDGQTTSTAHFNLGAPSIGCYSITARVTQQKLEILRATWNGRTSNNLTRAEILDQTIRLAFQSGLGENAKWSPKVIAKALNEKPAYVESRMRDMEWQFAIEYVSEVDSEEDSANTKGLRDAFRKHFHLSDCERAEPAMRRLISVFRDARATNGIIGRTLDAAAVDVQTNSPNREKVIEQYCDIVSRSPEIKSRKRDTSKGAPRTNAQKSLDTIAAATTCTKSLLGSAERVDPELYKVGTANIALLQRMWKKVPHE